MTLALGDPNLFGERPIVACSSGDIRVAAIPKDAANAIIKAGHYSGTVAWASSVHLGAWLGERQLGALQFGPAMNPGSGGGIVANATPETWLELNRLWLTDDKPPNTASRVIACALKLVRAWKPRVEWVQTFADSRCGKFGGVYQACSFLYCGSHESTFYELDGQWFHKSMLSRQDVDARGWGSGPRVAYFKEHQHRAAAHTFTQYRYLKFLSRPARRRLLLPVLSYPKPRATT